MKITKPELDYLTAIGDVTHLNVSTEAHRYYFTQVFEQLGLRVIYDLPGKLYLSNRDSGIQAYFTNEVMGRKLQGLSKISLSFSGEFFKLPKATSKAREILKFCSKKFGAIFKINRVDIRRDVYGAFTPWDYFPDFTDKENGLVWATRRAPKFKIFKNLGDFKTETGFSLYSSRYNIKSYNRQLNLDQGYAEGRISPGYYKYWKGIYKNENVQRFELTLKHDACKVFNILFFAKKYSIMKVLIFTLANFSKTHSLRKRALGKRISQCPINTKFAEIFYYQEKKTFKYFKQKIQEKLKIKVTDIVFSEKGRSIEETTKMLAKKIVTKSKATTMDMESIFEEVLALLRLHMDNLKDAYDDRLERFQRTLNAMGTSLDDYLTSKIESLELAGKDLANVN